MKIKSNPLTSWKEKPLGRITIHIHNLFEEHLKKHPLSDYREHNALLDVRNLIVQSVESFLNESAIKKKYGIPIDSTSLVSFQNNEEPVNHKSSWIPIPSDEDETRPAGITNEEFKEFSEKLNKLFIAANMYNSELHVSVTCLFSEAFLKPAVNKPFKAGTYVRLGVSGFIQDQAIPCEICGESRLIHMCHIIPRRLRGSDSINNILFLCPTHHGLFDNCMLSRDEWDKIDWGRKDRKSQIYIEKVLKIAHGNFWSKLDNGVYQKQNAEDMDVRLVRRLYRENKKDIEEES